MKGIVVTTESRASIRDFGDPLYKTVGEAVAGYIEHVKPVRLPHPYCMIVNEEGLLHGLALNTLGCALYGTLNHGQPIVGTIVLMKDGYRDGEPDIVGLEENDIQILESMLAACGIEIERSTTND